MITQKQLKTIIDSFTVDPEPMLILRNNNHLSSKKILSEDGLDIKNCFFMAGSFLIYSKKEYEKKRQKL